MYMCIYLYIHIHISTHMYIYLYIRVYTYMYDMYVTYLDTSVHAQLHHVYTYKQSKFACIFAYICTRIASPPGHRHVGAHKF